MYVVENEGAGETDMGFWFDAIVSHKDISLCANFLYLTFLYLQFYPHTCCKK